MIYMFLSMITIRRGDINSSNLPCFGRKSMQCKWAVGIFAECIFFTIFENPSL